MAAPGASSLFLVLLGAAQENLVAWGPEPVEPSLFLRPEVAAWEPLGPALKVAWGQQVKKAHPEALGVLGVLGV